MLHLTSKLILLKAGREAGWNVPEFLIPSFYPEYNVWYRFENRCKAVKLGKQESNTAVRLYHEAKDFGKLKGLIKTNIFLSQQSATDLSNIPDNSVDYVFTDPPYGGIIQYYELDLLRSAWLIGKDATDGRFKSLVDDEITINASQGKDQRYYHQRLHTAFREIFRVLKVGKYLTVTFHSRDIAIYNSIIRATLFAGFELEKWIYQPTEHISSKAGFHPYTSIEGDFYMRFRKAAEGELVSSVEEREVDQARANSIINLVLTKILVQRGQPATFTDLLKGQSDIYSELRKMGYLFFGANPDNIKGVLEEKKGEDFVFIEGEGWWLKEPHKHHPDVPLNDRVEQAVLQRLRRSDSTFTEILQEIYQNFSNSLTPDQTTVASVLEEYGERTRDGKWKIKPEVSSSINQHSMMIANLATLGCALRYNVWIGSRERREKFHGKELSSFGNLSDLKLSGATHNQLEHYLKQIDVIWIKDDIPYYAIEVEYSTAITEAFNRCSNLPATTAGVQKVIIIPKEREKMLYRKVNSTLLKENVKRDNWNFIFFDRFKQFYLTSRDKIVTESEFLSLAEEIKDDGNNDKEKFTILESTNQYSLI